jgi:dihydrodipicolinate synthase/N-acetylneuraminate lyase
VPKAPAVPKAKTPKATKELKDCPEGKVRNPITKRCVNEKKAPKAKAAKEANVDEVKEVIVKVVKEPKAPAVPKAPKAAKAPKELKECPEGKVRNPITKRCIKDVNYKKN